MPHLITAILLTPFALFLLTVYVIGKQVAKDHH